MTEWQSGWQVSFKLLVWVAFVTCYWWGGRQWRIVRWLGGGLVFAGGVIGVSLVFHTFHWRYLLGLVFYPIALSNGYSADALPAKVWRRALYGFLVGLCSLSFVTTTGLLLVAIFQATLAILASVLFGILNPFTDAPSEEAAIAAASTVFVPMMG